MNLAEVDFFIRTFASVPYFSVRHSYRIFNVYNGFNLQRLFYLSLAYYFVKHIKKKVILPGIVEIDETITANRKQ